MEHLESKMLQEQFAKMCATGKLFRSKVSGDQIWQAYMQGFGEDPIFRDPSSSVHNCNQCKHFFHRYGNIVAVAEDNSIMTMFDGETTDEYRESFANMRNLLISAPIENVFVETFDYLYSAVYERCTKQSSLFALNLDHTVKRYTKEEAEKFGVVKPNETRTFNHFCVRLPREFVNTSHDTAESIQARLRDDKNVFKDGLDKIPVDTLQLVLDLINQGSLLNGDTYKVKVESFLAMARKYASLSEAEKDNWCWGNFYTYNFTRFKNEVIGTLCLELAEGKEINAACLDFNKRVDPANYMKATAPITKQMIDNAKAFIAENGYEESFTRRCATMEDIRVCDILHANAGDGNVKPVSILDGIKPTSTRHKRSEFDGVEVVSIDKFMKDILPGCTSVEAFLLNSHENNFVTLTTYQQGCNDAYGGDHRISVCQNAVSFQVVPVLFAPADSGHDPDGSGNSFGYDHQRIRCRVVDRQNTGPDDAARHGYKHDKKDGAKRVGQGMRGLWYGRNEDVSQFPQSDLDIAQVQESFPFHEMQHRNQEVDKG